MRDYSTTASLKYFINHNFTHNISHHALVIMFKCSTKCYNLKHQPAKIHKTRTMEQLNGTKQRDFFFSLLSMVKFCWQAQTQIISTNIVYILHWLHDRWSPFNQLIISHEYPYHNITNGRQWSSKSIHFIKEYE